MTAVVRYHLATLLASQRWVAPLLTYLVFLGFFYATDAGAAVPAFGVTGFVLLPVVAWLTRQQLTVEDTAARQVTAASAGGLTVAHRSAIAAAYVAALPFAVVAVAWAWVADHTHTHSPAQLLGGLAIHAVFALAGVGLGAVCARPIVTAPGAAALAIVAVVVVALVVHVSPLFESLRALQNDPQQHFVAHAVPWLASLAALGLVGCAVSVRAAARE